MSQTTINNLQNTESYKNYVKDYLDNSLMARANEGQRFGINGKGVKYVEHNLHDILNTCIDNPNNTDGLKVYINSNNDLEIVIDNIYAERSDPFKITTLLSFDEYVNDEPLYNEVLYIINMFDKIHKNSFIKNDNLHFTCFLKGRLIDTTRAAQVYFQYDTIENKLLHFIFTQDYNAINDHDDWIIVYQIDYKTKGENNSYKYNLNVYIVRKYAINTIIKQLYNISDEDTNDDFISKFYEFNDDYDELNKQFSLFNPSFHIYEKLIEENIIDYDNLCFLNFIFNYTSNTYKQIFNNNNLIHFDNIELIKNSDASINFNENINDILLGYIDNYEVYELMTLLSDVNELEKSLLFTFNNVKYYKDKNMIFVYSLYNLLTTLNNNSKNNNGYLYVSDDYKIYSFTDDSKDIYKIYYTDNIYVNYVSSTNNLKYGKLYYVNDNNIDHIVVYKINVNYNNDYDDIINYINIDKIYSFPYINKLNNWVIDDVDTLNTSVEAKYTGIKEFYIYTSRENNRCISKFINIQDTSINGYFDYKETEFTIYNNYFIKYNNYNIKCKTNIPKINSDNSNSVDFFRNTLIISINDKKNIVNENNHDYQSDYKLNYVYSLWYFDESKKEFELYTINNEYAYDPFNNISIKDYFEDINNKYVSALLVPNNNEIPDDFETITTFESYLLVRNKTAKEYSNSYSTSGINYKNNYNLMLEYIDNFTTDGSNPNYPTSKFIDNISSITLTNSVYPIYEIETKFVDITNLISEYRANERNNYKTFVMINISSDNKLFAEIRSESDITVVYQKYSYYKSEFKEVELGLVRFNNQCYNEFIFNDNIPTIDLKEVFVRNTNILNRVNILGLENTNGVTKIYNGYIGTSINEDKNILSISTNSTNINVGNDTLLNTNQINKFSTYDTFNINGFNKIELNPINELRINANNVIRKYNNYLISSNIIIGKCNSFILCNFDENDNINFTTNNISQNSMFIPIYGHYINHNSENYYKILFNSVNLTSLIESTFSFSNNDYTIEYDDNKGYIIKEIDNSKYFIMLLDNNMFDQDITQNINTNINNEYVYNHMFNMYTYYDYDRNTNIVKFNFDSSSNGIVTNTQNVDDYELDSIEYKFANIQKTLIEDPTKIYIFIEN